MKAISIGNKFVSVGIFISLVISSSSSEYWSENRAIFVEGPSTVFSLFFWSHSSWESLASNRNWITRTGSRRSSRSPWNSFASTSALPPTNASGINREHSVAMQCYSSAYFCKKTFAIFTILNANNSQLEQSHRKTLEKSLLEISETAVPCSDTLSSRPC